MKNEELKLELDSQKMELGKVKEGVINDVRAEFRDEINHMKLSLDFFVSLVDPATLQTALSRVTSHGAQKIANEVLPSEICQESHSVPNSGITNLQVGGQVFKLFFMFYLIFMCLSYKYKDSSSQNGIIDRMKKHPTS